METEQDRKNDPEFSLYVLLKHGIRLEDNLKKITGSDDPFYLFQEAGMSKGKLCEILAREIVREIRAGGLPGFRVDPPGSPAAPGNTTKGEPS